MSKSHFSRVSPVREEIMTRERDFNWDLVSQPVEVY